MKIALISPRGALTNNKTLIEIWTKDPAARAYHNSLSGIGTGLLIIAALTPSSFEVEFIDENHEKIDFDKEYDLVGVSFMTQQATRAYEIIDTFRCRDIPVIAGGIHTSTIPDEVAEHANSIVIGEGENIWPIVIKDFVNGKLQKFYNSNNPVELKGSPIPRFQLLKPEYYKIVWLQTTRGCPRACEFCSVTNVYGSKCRHKAIEQVLNEIKLLKRMSPKLKIGFADDNMFIDRTYSKKLIQKLKYLGIRWFAQTDISIAEDLELLNLLKDSNCMSLFIGFESISKETLKSIDRFSWKATQVENYPKAIETIQSFGIGIVGSFIVGLDGDDSTIFDKLANFIIENHIYAVQITVPTPLPGTRLRERLKRENRLLSTNWSKYTFTDVTFSPAKMTPEELERGLERLYKQVYNQKVFLEKNLYFKEIIYKKLIEKETLI